MTGAESGGTLIPADAASETLGRSRSDLLARIVVWGVWAFMVRTALAYVSLYASQIPFGDDWNYLEAFAGARPVSAAWFWELDYSHRLVLSRALLLALGHLTEFDLMVPRYVNVLLMAASAMLLIRAARRVRGLTSVADAWFPIAFMHVGHASLFLQFHYLVSGITIALLVGFLAAAVGRAEGPGPAGSLAGVTCLLGLPICGAVGVAATPALAVWLALMGRDRLRDGDPRARNEGRLFLLIAGSAALLVGLYFVGYRTPPDSPPSPGVLPVAVLALQFMSMGFGPAVRIGWPFSGVGVLRLPLACAAALLAVHRARPHERSRTGGLLACLAAMLLVAFAFGYGRAGYAVDRPETAFMDRYAVNALPLFCVCYFAWLLPSPWPFARAVQALIPVVAAILVFPNHRYGLGMGNSRADMNHALMNDLRRGLAPREAAARHWPMFLGSEAGMARGLELMRAAKIGPYRVPAIASGQVTQDFPLVSVLAAGGNSPAPVALRGHTDRVRCVAFSPDGALLASGGDDGAILLWDPRHHLRLARFDGHAGPVAAVAFARDGRTLVSAGWDGTVRLWDVLTHTQRRVLSEDEGGVAAVAVTADGSRIASGSSSGLVTLWHPGDARLSHLPWHTLEVRCLSFASSGRMLASAGWDPQARLWDVETGRARATLAGHAGAILSVAFAPNEATVASAGWDGTVRTWEAATGRPRATLRGHRGAVTSVAYAPDGRTIASSGWDSTVILWDLQGRPRAVLNGPADAVSGVAWSVRGQVAAASWDRKVWVWNVPR